MLAEQLFGTGAAENVEEDNRQTCFFQYVDWSFNGV